MLWLYTLDTFITALSTKFTTFDALLIFLTKILQFWTPNTHIFLIHRDSRVFLTFYAMIRMLALFAELGTSFA
jgi:hypothetical protein